MRTLTVNTTTKTQTRLATEPVMILAINWSTGVQYYGDKSFVLAPNSIQGKLLEFSPIQATGKQDTSGEVSSASVTLDDVDGTLKVLWNTIIMEGTIVSAYHHYEGNAWSDLTLVFKGKIGGNIEWDEGQRQLKFDIETYIDDAEVGYAPEEGDIVDMNNDAAGVMWPIVFGGVLRLKTIPIKKGTISNNTDGILGGWPVYDSTPFEVKDGNKFPQGVTIDIVVNATRFTGYFDGNIFHRQISNLLWYSNVVIAPRLTQDVDSSNPKVMWISGSEDLSKKQCWLGPNKQYNYCERQEGRKCYFMFDWDHLLTDTDTAFQEVRGNVHNTWFNNTTNWLNYWYIKPQCQVYQYNKGYSDLYIVNEYPSTQVVEVMAKRTYDGKEIFVQVPSSYYTIHYSYNLNGRFVTAIEFPKPLSTYEDEQWQDDIFVSVRSTLPSNIADIIKWLVEEYTTFGVDAASFAQARLDVAPYPANFALFSPRNVLSLIEDIAWQGRCALFVHNGVISIKYLSKNMPVDYTMTRTDVLLKTLKMGFVPTEEITTKLTGTWKLDYSGEELTEKKIIYKNNIDLFGLRSQDRDVFIYNIEELAKMTIYFWGYRYSNSWRIMQYPTLLRTLPLELFDCAAHSMITLSTYVIRGIIEDISHDSVENTIALRAILCSKAGQHLGGQPIEDAYFWIGDPNYVVTPRAIIDPLSGRQIVDYVVPVIDDNKTKTNDNNNNTPTSEYKFVFVLPLQDEVERGTNFPIKIQLQDMAGKRIYNTVSCKLSLASEDSADRLTTNVVEKSITLTNGEYNVTNEQITGGTTIVAGASLACADSQARENYHTGTSELFRIINVKTGTLTWSTNPPATVRRGVVFPVAISGGLNTEILDVSLILADLNDAVYLEDGTPLTTITLGVGGTYSGNWYVSGGTGAETNCFLRLIDSRYSKYANSDSTTFNISQTDILQQIVQTFAINPLYNDELDPNDNSGTSGGGLKLDPADLEFTFISGSVDDNHTFRLRARLLDSDGNPIDFDETVSFTAYDPYGSQLTYLAPSGTMQIDVNMVDGVFEGDFKLSVPDYVESPVTLYAKLIYQGEEYLKYIDKPLMLVQRLEQSVPTSHAEAHPPIKEYKVEIPLNVTRGVPFNVVITALNSDGMRDTSYTPDGTLLTPVSTDPADDVTPINVPDGSWATGQVTVSFTLTGGAGIDGVHFIAEEEHYGYAGTSPEAGVGTSSTVIGADFWRATWTGVDAWGSGEEQELNHAVYLAYIAMQGATKVVSTATAGVGTGVMGGVYEDWDYGGGDQAYAISSVIVNRYNITDPQKANAMGLRLRVRLGGAKRWPDQYVTGYGTACYQGNIQVGFSDTEPNNYSDLVANFNQAAVKICFGGYVTMNYPYGGGPSLGMYYGWYDHVPPPFTLTYNYADIDIPVSYLRTMTGNKLHIWMMRNNTTLNAPTGRPWSDGGHNGLEYMAFAGCETVSMTINA